MADPSNLRQVRPTDDRGSVGEDRADEETFTDVLGEVTGLLDEEDIDHVIMGGVAIAALARPRWTHDIDVFVRPDTAGRALHVLERAGYETEETDPMWLFKSWKDGVLVDLIFRSVGGYYLDEDMLERSSTAEFKGVPIRVLPPEDLLVIKAAAHREDCPYHWFDAVALLASQEMDWDYLLDRARRAIRRVLSLLLYAQSNDTAVPTPVIEALFDHVRTTPERP